jgi:hypothetical protein
MADVVGTSPEVMSELRAALCADEALLAEGASVATGRVSSHARNDLRGLD